MNFVNFYLIQKNPAISDRVDLGTNHDQEISAMVYRPDITKGNDHCFADS